MMLKACGCRVDGLTRNVTVWQCEGCGKVQTAKRRICSHCARRKPDPPKGFGCCGEDWPEHRRACGTCGRLADPDLTFPLPHPEHLYLSEDVERGTFEDRHGRRRCVGCLELESKPLHHSHPWECGCEDCERGKPDPYLD